MFATSASLERTIRPFETTPEPMDSVSSPRTTISGSAVLSDPTSSLLVVQPVSERTG